MSELVEVETEPLPHSLLSQGISNVATVYEYNDFFIIANLKRRTEDTNAVEFDVACSCGYCVTNFKWHIPRGKNSVKLMCSDCEIVLARISGIETLKWKIEVPKEFI